VDHRGDHRRADQTRGAQHYDDLQLTHNQINAEESAAAAAKERRGRGHAGEQEAMAKQDREA